VKLYIKSWRVLTTIMVLFIAWLFILQLAGFTSNPQRILQMLAIVLMSSIVPLSLLKNQILDYNSFRKKEIIKQLSFLFIASIVICAVLLYDLSRQAYMVIFLPLLEEWFFRGLLLPSLALVNVPTAIIVSSLMFSLTHYYYFRLDFLLTIFIYSVVVAKCQVHYKSISLPMSMHVAWNWCKIYASLNFYESGLTYYGGLAIASSYIIGWFIQKVWEHRSQADKGISRS